MSKKQIKRINKTKKDIVSNIQLVHDAERRRALIKDVVFPYLVEMNDTIGYTKVFLQAFNGLVNGVFDETRKTTTIGQIHQNIVNKLDTIFNVKDAEQKKEYERYVELVTRLKDISIQDLTYATELPRYIDGYNTQKVDKNSISTISIEEILGK